MECHWLSTVHVTLQTSCLEADCNLSLVYLGGSVLARPGTTSGGREYDGDDCLKSWFLVCLNGFNAAGAMQHLWPYYRLVHTGFHR